MNAMLGKLLLLRFRGGLRQRLNELKTLRGTIFALITLAVICLIIVPTFDFDNAPLNNLLDRPEPSQEQIERFMPLGLFAAFLTTVFTSSGPSIYFSPSEINLLFCAPLKRQALLLYKMCFYAFGAFLSSLLIMFLVPISGYSSISTFLGIFLTFIFIQLLSTSVNILTRLITKRFACRSFRSIQILLLVVLVSAFVGLILNHSNSMALLDWIQASVIGSLILAPFKVFVHIFLAQSLFPDLIGWVLVALGMIALLITSIIVFDEYSYEASLIASFKRQERWDQLRRSGLIGARQPGNINAFRFLRIFNLVSPLSWWQFLRAFRSYSKPLSALFIAALLSGPVLVIACADISLSTRIGIVFFIWVYFLPKTLVFDFRSDIDSMETLKTLPVSALKISMGQLITPVIFSSLIELLMLSSVATLLYGISYTLTISLMPFVLPFNLLLYGLENLFFLIFPAPLVPVGRVDFDFLGRNLVQFAITSSLLIGGCSISAITGLILMKQYGFSWTMAVIAAWLVLCIISLLTLPLNCWCFSRFNIVRS